MFELQSVNGTVKVFAETIESEAVSQILNMANSPIGKDAHIRIMPDAHAGAGCTIGTTMKVNDRVCPNLVGVDIGCGVDLIKTDIDFEKNLAKLDEVIRKEVPSGTSIFGNEIVHRNYFSRMVCWDKLDAATQETALRSMGTLGGGNHFIEAYEDGHIAVHTGSRNIGYKVAEFYQKLAEKELKEKFQTEYRKVLMSIEPKKRQDFINQYKKEIPNYDLAWLKGEQLEAYLHDIRVMQDFARDNRMTILANIAKNMGCRLTKVIATTIHNYIDIDHMILRKGAVSARARERLVIPLNMRDGIMVCIGKGNADWNYSAPHGAGRLYSRSKAKALFTVDEYAESMQGIYTTCVSQSTLDEAPFVYKDVEEIRKAVEPTVDIMYTLKPVYNFKA